MHPHDPAAERLILTLGVRILTVAYPLIRRNLISPDQMRHFRRAAGTGNPASTHSCPCFSAQSSSQGDGERSGHWGPSYRRNTRRYAIARAPFGLLVC